MFRMTLKTHRAFSLVEILVVVLILGVLMAVAVPRMLSGRDRAADSAAQQTLNGVITAARSEFSVRDTFNFDLEDFADGNTEYDIVTGAGGAEVSGNTRQVHIAVDVTNGDWFRAAAPGADVGGGLYRCWYVQLNRRTADRYHYTENTENCQTADLTTNGVNHNFPIPGDSGE